MFRKIAIVTPTLFAAVAVKNAGSDSKPPTDELAHYKCKPSELPMYAPLHSHNKVIRESHPPKNSAVQETIEGGIRVVRSNVQAGVNAAADQTKQLNHIVETGVAHTQSSVDYLREPNNLAQRSGAIAAGGVTGLVFAIRGGFIKKLLYASIGAGAVASVCYPTQAEHYARDALFEARKGFAIAYNFVKGVKPGDEVPVEPINKFPTNIDELKLFLWDLYDDAKEAVFSSKKK